MSDQIFTYFERRAAEEEQYAATATVPAVRATHQRFALFYRERLAAAALVPADWSPDTSDSGPTPPF